MSETVQIPKGWELSTLDKICIKITDRDHTTPKYTKSGIPLISPKDFTPSGISFLNCKFISKEDHQKNCKRTDLKKGDILFSRIGTVGETRLIDSDKEFSILHSIVQIRPDLTKVSKKFLYYFLQSGELLKTAKIGIQSVGTPDLGIKKIRSFQIILPPLATQKKIVQKLDDILGQLEEKKREILKILELQKKRQLLLSNNYLSHKTAELIPVENAPNHWKLIKLGDTFNESDKKWLPNGKSELVNYIGLENIESNTGNLVRFSPTESSKIKSNKTIFTKNMVLYGKLRPYLNKVLLPTFDGICSTDILGLNPKSNTDRTFLAYFLRSWHVLSPVNRAVHGTKMPRTKIQVLQEIPIALPPIGEQKEIIKKIIQSDKTTTIIKNSIQEIQEKAEKSIQYQEHLQSSILDAAFSGKLVK